MSNTAPVSTASTSALSLVVGLAAALLSVCPAFGQAARSVASESAALGLGENRDGAVLALVRELTEWRNRALGAESQLEGLGVEAAARSAQKSASACVLRSVPEERILLVSVGREVGALPGALLVVGDGVYARIVEARNAVSAALVDQGFSGSITNLQGAPVRLAVR